LTPLTFKATAAIDSIAIETSCPDELIRLISLMASSSEMRRDDTGIELLRSATALISEPFLKIFVMS
jgi:hypothetical protein